MLSDLHHKELRQLFKQGKVQNVFWQYLMAYLEVLLKHIKKKPAKVYKTGRNIALLLSVDFWARWKSQLYYTANHVFEVFVACACARGLW